MNENVEEPEVPLSFYYNSISEESLNHLSYGYEPVQYSNYPRRRLSASDLQEMLCAQGHQLHIDPRYRDTRPIARSSSSLYLYDNISPSRSRTDLCNPTIFIEEYNDDAVPVTVDDNQSNDSASLVMRRASIVSQAHQPLNEDGIASVADSEEEIPFIDDEFEVDDEIEVYVPTSRNSRKSGIMVSSASASERRASSACRKTVSFDLVEDESSKRNSISLDRENANFSRKSSTLDAISSYYNTNQFNRGSNDSLGNYNQPHPLPVTTCLPKVQIFNELDLELEVECPSPCHRQLNPERSTSPLMNKQQQRRRSMSNVPVPLRKFSSSSEVSMIKKNMKPPAKYSSYNSFNTPSIVIEPVCEPSSPSTTVKQFGEGKVRELAEFFESKKTVVPSKTSKCFQYQNQSQSKFISKSTPNLCAVNMLNEEEQCKVLRQLEEWGIYGTSGRDYSLDFSDSSQKHFSFFNHRNRHEQKHDPQNQCTQKPYRSDSCLACCSHCCCVGCCRQHGVNMDCA